jgi:sortase A
LARAAARPVLTAARALFIDEDSMLRLISPIALAIVGILLFGDGTYIHGKAWLAQLLLNRAFDRSVATGEAVKPWSWADTWPIARIEVKRIGASAIVLEGTSGQALAFGPGHLSQTIDAGERGIAVYAAHRDTHFRFLKNVAIGDVVDVARIDGQHVRYRVDSSAVVNFDASGLEHATQDFELVLATCWPFDAVTSGPERYILHATLIGTGR